MERRYVGRPRGHKLSKKSKRKISETKKGQKHSEETRKKIAESITNWWAERKAISLTEKEG